MRALIVTSSFARSIDDPAAAAGKGIYELVAELGREIEGTLVTPAVPDAPSVEHLGGIEVRRIAPARPESSLANAVTGRGAIRLGERPGREPVQRGRPAGVAVPER